MRGLLLGMLLALALGAQARELVEAAAFAIPGQTQVLQRLISDDGVYASVRYTDPASSQRKSALVCWRLDGTLRWRKELQEAYQLARAGDLLVLAYDDGTRNAQRGLFWLSAATGEIVTEATLPGRPCALRDIPAAGLILLVLMPQHRLQTLDGAWMEVRAYDRQGRQQWLWKIAASELQLLPASEDAVVLLSQAGGQETMTRLNPRDGTVLWQRPPVSFLTKPPLPGIYPPEELRPDLARLVRRITPNQVIFFATATGDAVLDGLPREYFPAAQYLHAGVLRDVVYYAASSEQALTIAAIRYPYEDLRWKTTLTTVNDCVRDPVLWDGNLAFIGRKHSAGFVGTTVTTELRVYTADGELLACLPREMKAGHYWDDTVPLLPAGHRLYAVDQGRLVALQWQEI